MRVTFATQAAPGRPNEDFVAATPDTAVLLDGAGTPPGFDSGCSHGVAWYSHTLGSTLIASTSRGPNPLPELVLSNSVLVLDITGTPDPTVICDDREAQIGAHYRAEMDALDSGSDAHVSAHRRYVETLRSHRNRDGGFWVAATDPLAADQALTGNMPADRVRAAALLSDGASRLVDRFHLATWREALNTLDQHGPANLISTVRTAEHSDPHGERWPCGKTYDDATAAHISFTTTE
ncbi:integrase [Nonomuraea sp. NPDC050227]|uniref:integrase n=1 Tax=Nonomuraea sp. NPDC050227 TaxID=3364360 RepID=UPI003794142B